MDRTGPTTSQLTALKGSAANILVSDTTTILQESSGVQDQRTIISWVVIMLHWICVHIVRAKKHKRISLLVLIGQDTELGRAFSAVLNELVKIGVSLSWSCRQRDNAACSPAS